MLGSGWRSLLAKRIIATLLAGAVTINHLLIKPQLPLYGPGQPTDAEIPI